MNNVLFQQADAIRWHGSREAQVAKLRSLANELLATAEEIELSALQEVDTASPVVDRSKKGRCLKETIALEARKHDLLWLAESLIKARNERDRCLPVELFHDPAHDVLLDLFVHRLKGRRLSVTGVNYGTKSPPTTVLRHLTVLEEHGLIERQPAEGDRRITWLDLTSDGYCRIAKFLLSWGEVISGKAF